MAVVVPTRVDRDVSSFTNRKMSFSLAKRRSDRDGNVSAANNIVARSPNPAVFGEKEKETEENRREMACKSTVQDVVAREVVVDGKGRRGNERERFQK